MFRETFFIIPDASLTVIPDFQPPLPSPPLPLQCPMTHDGYLKLWQLSKPSLGEYDAFLVDEAQDMNPCMLDVIRRQIPPKIFVGDPHQQIYAFRGSVNVLDLVEATHTFSLTQSFRFGEPIAFAAQSILNQCKGEPNLLIGSDKESKITCVSFSVFYHLQSSPTC